MPLLLPRFVVTPDGERFVPLEQVIAAHLDALFPGMDVDHFPFRVTRNADLTLEDEDADDLLVAVEIELRRRRFGRAVRLEVEVDMTDEIRELLASELDLTDDDVYLHGPDRPGRPVVAARLDRPDLKDPVGPGHAAPPRGRARRRRASIFAVIRRRTSSCTTPTTSFATSVEEFIRQAAVDPKVLAIKMTLYRTSGDSPIVARR